MNNEIFIKIEFLTAFNEFKRKVFKKTIIHLT